MAEDGSAAAVPAGWRVLSEKAAGAHAPMLCSTDGCRLLKPLDQGKRSLREVEAYEELRRSPLGPFLSGFHGVRRVGDEDYMELDCSLAGMQGPCATLDVKIGRLTWEDDAPPEKVAKETKKYEEFYAASSAADGFRVCGMKAGDLRLDSRNLQARHGLLGQEFGGWLLPAFFASGPGYGPLPEGLAGGPRPDARGSDVDVTSAREVLGHLRVLAAAAELGFGGSLRAASVLLVREMRAGGRWSMRLIDLAHYSKTAEPRDANFCDGLQNFVRAWEAWCSQ